MIDSIQATSCACSQSITKQFLNGFFGGGLFNKDGSMTQKDSSFFDGFAGQKIDAKTYKSSDEWGWDVGSAKQPPVQPDLR